MRYVERRPLRAAMVIPGLMCSVTMEIDDLEQVGVFPSGYLYNEIIG
jgi:hypothetical protein